MNLSPRVTTVNHLQIKAITIPLVSGFIQSIFCKIHSQNCVSLRIILFHEDKAYSCWNIWECVDMFYSYEGFSRVQLWTIENNAAMCIPVNVFWRAHAGIFVKYFSTRRITGTWGMSLFAFSGYDQVFHIQSVHLMVTPYMEEFGCCLTSPTIGSVQFSSSAVTLCNPMDCSMPYLPVHHQLPEFTQTHVH